MSTYNYGSRDPLAHVTYDFLDAVMKDMTSDERRSFLKEIRQERERELAARDRELNAMLYPKRSTPAEPGTSG